MSKIDYENIKPFFLRNLVLLLDMGFISYDINCHEWVLLNGIETFENSKRTYGILYDSISDEDLKIVLEINGKETVVSFSEFNFNNSKIVFNTNVNHESIDRLVRNIFYQIKEFNPKYHEIDFTKVVPYSKPMADKRIGTLLCPESNEEFDDEDNDEKIFEFDIETNKDIRIFPAYDSKLSDAITLDDQKRINEIKERFYNTSSRILEKNKTKNNSKETDISISSEAENTFVSQETDIELNTPFDKVIAYFIERGILDKLQFTDNIFVTLKSHMIIGTNVFVEAGISELSYKNNIVKIKHIVGEHMEETKLEFSYVFDKIESGDIYIRPFDMYRGKKIYTVKID